MHAPEPEWKNDCFGNGRQALYIGGLVVGTIMQARNGRHAPYDYPWHGLIMSDDNGHATGWHATADEARASVEAALKAALEET